MEAINAALRKIKYRGEQKLTQYLLTEEDMTRISTVNTWTAWHLLHHPWGRSICHILCSLAGDCCTSTSTQAERVFSWVGFLLNKRRLSLSGGESVTMQPFLNDNLELWVDVCLIPRWDDNKLWYPHIASKLICFPGDIFVLIGFVIIGG